MVAVRPADAERFLASPPEGIRVFLIFGSDAGAVTERARTLETAALRRGGGEHVLRLGSDELSSNPGIIADECYAASLFGGEPVVSLRVLDGRHGVANAVEPLLEKAPEAAWLIVEAGELQASSALRKGFEACSHAAAIPTYPPTEKDLAAMVHSMASDHGIIVQPDAMDLLLTLLGSDRLATRAELEKLFLYAAPDPVDTAAVSAIVGETAELRQDAVIDAALLGDNEEVEAGLRRLEAEGSSAGALGSQALRHLILLSALRARVDAGERPAQTVESARPPIFFKRKPAVEAALKRWTTPALRHARQWMSEAVEASRRQPALEAAQISAALIRTAQLARRLSA